MTEEIKRIIEELKDNIPIEECRSEGTSDGLTHYEEDKDSWQYKLLDYITNLQQENEKLKYNARGQVNDYFKDKYADEVLKKADLIKDFELTCYKNYELKQEIERLNNIINTFEEDLEREVNISEQDSMVGNYRYTVIHSTLEKMLKYFKELKESDNNEG